MRNPFFNEQGWDDGANTRPGTYDPWGDGQASDQQSWASQQDWQDGITSGLAAGAANSQPKDRFTINPYAGYQGSAQGLASGGWIGAAIGGATAQFGQYSKINKELKKLNTSVDGVTYDAYGRPVYQGGNVTQAIGDVQALNDGEDALTGAKTWVDPANKAFSWAYGTKRKIRRKRSALQAGITNAQNDFNTSDVNFRNQANQFEDYYQRQNSNSRLYSLYRSQY